VIHQLYCVYDRVAELAGPVFQAVNDGVARRAAMQMLGKVPEYDRDSFSLRSLGSFDDVGVTIIAENTSSEVSLAIPKFDEVKPRQIVGGVDEVM
jgi:hypothetical protein